MSLSTATIYEQLALADQLLAGRDSMLEPQDLPGRYGRVVKALEHALLATNAQAVVAGDWAVWRHGYVGRVTQDVEVVLASADLPEFLRVAAVSGFDVLAGRTGHWPKLVHRDTGIDVDVLPEGERPGTPSRPASTMIRNPSTMGADGSGLRYISLESLVELKLAAGRARDRSDIVELIRADPDATEAVRRHLAGIHADYVTEFDVLLGQAREESAG